jgi:hypothetical protein
MKIYPAHFKGTYRGKRYSLFTVMARFNDSRLCATLAERFIPVLAASGRDALEYAAHLIEYRPETELYTWGPKGGEFYRFISWESSIGEQLMRNHVMKAPAPVQLTIEALE